jgi:hypothetical protein
MHRGKRSQARNTYSITSSARAKSAGGIVKRSALAVDGDTIAGLVSGLATARRENMKPGSKAIEVVRIRITGAGRDALVAKN